MTYTYHNTQQTINLHGNHIESIGSDVFESNIFVEKLDLAKNRLSWLPPGLFRNSKKMSDLNLERNLVEKISLLHINHLVNLRSLDLTFNKVSQFTETSQFTEFNRLKKLMLTI